ncbi:MAG: ribosomal RNA small subunit methyltransferase A [Candidatus Zambryskibacteria bacterium RIFCSPHIGHO2_02_FULL_43_14]|uniref:Ribosomal RNA small subunit methyltransferase A n=1 Tax=Candidatus Zambryskibacteria bacterium RIFCSPHIGHO2_02_FULL_43_14 TaxID=1802748 RepID=A0A1G2TIL8_9BACT|nr:MAG: ribosomal RNA small subunit methyltransferase A [Candidatus Zambryskibacteria bacterium RIFCSPHIGHO2_01_FULL_43_60]OHA97032.1 MAG: ribosomal RNA small subunit methyltransferase A [Candidatus Zambryskibacteria bacterium RIFCSPHIGHO2_02_FULL_43_14]OHB03757.1 MAG: ribosomal RNA small subunit methyltransferase A [Candidatus Zambryskibacteria bacterium RIFCSPLOWO2_01_FULL_42_41]
MRAKKSLGQHFLKSERALATIVEVGNLSVTDTVLEIGPGTGTLTEKLLAIDCQVLAIEKDDNLYDTLKIKFQKEIVSGQLKLIHDDILKFDFKKLTAKSYKLIANIPYNITGAILKKFLSAEHQPKQMVLLMQKEVAKRIVAQDDKESILSISVKAYGIPRYVETVKAGSFAPMPKVDSAIVVIENISKNYFKNLTEKDFFEIVRAGFKSKRKKLSSNLSTIFHKDKVQEVFQKLKLDRNLRAEDADIKIWHKLTLNLFPL